MSVKEDFEKLNKEHEILSKEAESLRLKRCDVEFKKNELLADYLLEEAILSEYAWHITGEDRWANLECTKRSSDWKTLSDLAEDNYHCYKTIEKGINLNFNDGKINISFQNGISQMAEFIKKYKLNIASSSIALKYKKLKMDLAALEEAHRLLHGKDM